MVAGKSTKKLDANRKKAFRGGAAEIQKQTGGLKAKDPAREELRQKSLKTDPEFSGEVKGKAREEEIKNIAQKNVNIDKGEEAIKQAATTEQAEAIPTAEIPTSQEDLNAELERQGIEQDITAIQNDFLQRSQGLKPLEEMALYQQVLLNIAATGGTKLPGQFASFGAADITAEAIASGNVQQTAVEKSLQAGSKLNSVTTTAGNFAANGKSAVLTKKWLIGLGVTMFVADKLVDVIGTYPFAGFINEEAVQTTGFGFTQADKNDDLIGMEEAIKQQEELLESTQSASRFIPYKNVLDSLKKFYESARIKLRTDKRTFEKRRVDLGRQ